MKKRIELEGSCTGCRVCASVCAFHNAGSQNWKHGRILIVKEEPDTDYPVICRQCAEPACLKACKFGALVYNAAGVLTVTDACTGCGACVRACQYSGIHISALTKKAVKCDLCNGKPVCVEHCPVHVLAVKEVEE
jgi:phenylglyoxylate dehydrogenase beta subunit